MAASEIDCDVCIVGGGIAGLYLAYRLSTELHERVCLVEADTRWGGRAGSVPFAGTRVQIGAGVGRLEKDARLVRLCKDLALFDAAHAVFPMRVSYCDALLRRAGERGPVAFVREGLRRVAAAARRGGPPTTFARLGKEVLGKDDYALLVRLCGFSDFEKAEARDAAAHYGLDDLYERRGQHLFRVDWDALVSRLLQALRARGCLLMRGHRAVDILKPQASGDSGGEFGGESAIVVARTQARDIRITTRRQVVLATAAGPAQELLRAWRKEEGARGPKKGTPAVTRTRGQPFARVYARFSGRCADFLSSRVADGMTILEPPLQSMYPVDRARGVYLVAYSDNASAVRVRRALGGMDPEPGRDWLGRSLARMLAAPFPLVPEDHKMFYWDAGTHYTAPAKTSTTKQEGAAAWPFAVDSMVSLVGEAFSRHQGWVEGALESSDRVVEKLRKA